MLLTPYQTPPTILVIGDLMIDHYIFGQCNRISPEAPVQVVEVSNEQNRLGGACNVAHNLIALGAKVKLCGVIGKDILGEKLIHQAQELGIDTTLIFQDSSRPTTQKSRILVSNQQILRVDRENKQELDSSLLDSMLQALQQEIQTCDGIILSDYGKGVLNAKITQQIIALANQHQKIILCDPKGNDYSKYNNATLITPNKKEAFEATQIHITDKQSLLLALQSLQKICNPRYPLITLSEDGIALLTQSLQIIPTLAQEVYDVTGAGDTVISALCFALSLGEDILKACEFANLAAAVVVGKVGSAVASQEEIAKFAKTYLHPKDNIQSKIIPLSSLPKCDNLVFTNGCFDILHKGHAKYLQEAKALGDMLVVGLNTDSSIKALKGESRPINTQENRAYVLASLECVDYVILFDELTPYNLIKAIKPKILVKGADYENKEVVGSEFAQEVKLLEFTQGLSTSNIISKILDSKEEQ